MGPFIYGLNPNVFFCRLLEIWGEKSVTPDLIHKYSGIIHHEFWAREQIVPSPTAASTPKVKTPGGFTLIEFLVALAITSILTTMVYMSFSSSFEMMEKVGSVSSRDRQVRITFSIIARELLASLPSPSQATETFLSLNGEVNGQPADTLTFFSFSHVRTVGEAAESDLSRLSYRLENGSLMHREWVNPFSSSPSVVENYELANGLSGFNLRFYDGERWVDEWTSSRYGTLPEAVSVELISQTNGPEVERAILKVHLPKKGTHPMSLPPLLPNVEEVI